MSLYRQLILLIVASTVAGFLGSFAAGTLSARASLERQLAIRNADHARVLALSLSQLPKDRETIELQVATLFQEGGYELVRVVDSGGKTLAEKKSAAVSAGVPGWFTGFLPIQPAAGRAEIADGPGQFGAIELKSMPGFAYRELYDGTLTMLKWCALAGLLTGALAWLALGRIRRPLAAVVAQAEAIGERRFVTIPEPAAPELLTLVRAMNHMVARVQAMFAEEAARLEEVRRAANCDDLTGLSNRSAFLAQVAGALEPEAVPASGVLVFLRLRDLAGINLRQGHQVTDAWLKDTARVLRERAEAVPGGCAGRLNGADFALLLPGMDIPEAKGYGLIAALVTSAPDSGNGVPATVAVGLAHYRAGEALPGLLARTDAVLATAEAQPGNGLVATEDAPARGTLPTEAWRPLLLEALAAGRLDVAGFPTCGADGALLHRECFVRLEIDGQWLAAGRFLPFVARLRLEAPVDLAVARRVLEEARRTGLPVALNLSAASLEEPGFLAALVGALDEAGELASRCWLEIQEDSVFRHFEAFTALAEALRPRPCRLGIDRFGRRFAEVGRLHGLGVDYFKVDASFIRDIDRDPGNRNFLKGLAAVAHGVGALVIAEGVQGEAERQWVFSLGFDGATGPGIKVAG